jgi:hypothetical protein
VERMVEESDAVFGAAECKGEGGNGEGFDFDSRIFKGLSPSQRKKILRAFLEYDDRFARPGDKLGTCTAVEHAIDTRDAKPIRQAPRAKAWRERVIVAGQCKELLDAEVIEEPTDAETMAKSLEVAREEVSIWLGRVQEKQKERYDMGHQVAKEFQPGEEVLVYKPIRKIGRAEKLLHHWHGPYVVQRKTASLNYEVKQKDKRKTEIVHVGKMKTFLGSERK